MGVLGIAQAIYAFFKSPVGKLALGALAIFAAGMILLGLKHGYDERRRDEGRAEVRREEVAPLLEQRDAARKRATDLALLWASSLDRIETESRKRQEAERERNTALKQRAAALNRAPTLVISPDAVRLWRDITPVPVGPDPAKESAPEVDRPGTAAFSESALLDFVNSAKAAYDDAVGLYHDARDALAACIASTQPEESKP